MDNEASASTEEWEGGGRALGNAGPPDPSYPSSPNPQYSYSYPSSSSSSFVMNNVSGEREEASEMPFNNDGASPNLQESCPAQIVDDATSHADFSQSNGKVGSKPSRLSNIIDRVQARVTVTDLSREEKNESTSMEMDTESVKGIRKRPSDEALEQPNEYTVSKSRRADVAQSSLSLNQTTEKRQQPTPNLATTSATDNAKGNQTASKDGVPFSYKYSDKDKAPFVVYIYTKNNSNSEAAHPLLVSKLIANIAFNDIIELKKIGKGKIMTELKSAKAANNLVSSDLLDSNNLKAFIPAYRTLRTGIVKDVPPSISVEAIHKAMEAPTFKILEVKRFNRRIQEEGQTKTVPSSTICVKFAGQFLPKHVYIFKTRHEVTPFIPKTKVCYRCFRVGHISASCRSSERCLKCGQNKHAEESSCPATGKSPTCINCKGEHLATSPNCPIAARQGAIASLAAINNIPLFEARKMINQSHYSPSSFNSSPIHSSSQDTYTNNNCSYPQLNRDPRLDFQNFPFLHSNPTTNQNVRNSYAQPLFQHNRFEVLNSDEEPSAPSGPSSGSYANAAASRRHSPNDNRIGNPAHSSNRRSFTQADSRPAYEERAMEGTSPHPSPFFSRTGPQVDPGRPLHLNPNGRTPSLSSNGVAFDKGNNSGASSTGDIPYCKDFVKDISNFFFQNLLPLFLRGEYSTVFDTSLKFIFNYFNMNVSAHNSAMNSVSNRFNNFNDDNPNITSNQFLGTTDTGGGSYIYTGSDAHSLGNFFVAPHSVVNNKIQS